MTIDNDVIRTDAGFRWPRLRPEDLDRFFPWMIFSLFLNTIIWGGFLWGVHGSPFHKKPVLSQVEISLAPHGVSARKRPPPAKGIHHRKAPARVLFQQPETVVADPTRQPGYSRYVKNWEARIMQAAQKNHLGVGRTADLQGHIVVAVTIAPDGQLMALSLLQGAKNKVLVTAVDAVIRSTAPFAPLPVRWRSAGTPLRIVRTWSFHP